MTAYTNVDETPAAAIFSRYADPMDGISSINGAFSSAAHGIDSGLSALSSDAQAVASRGPDVGAMVNASQQRLAIEASAKALAVANQTLGSLIDLFA